MFEEFGIVSGYIHELNSFSPKARRPLDPDLDPRVTALERTELCFAKMHAQEVLVCNFAKANAVAGEVLTHSFKVVDQKLRTCGPMVFKLGFTHCPFTRFFNPKFGYFHDRHQKWERMIILHVSHECVGPAFLEAALIQRYKGLSIALHVHGSR